MPSFQYKAVKVGLGIAVVLKSALVFSSSIFEQFPTKRVGYDPVSGTFVTH